MSRYERFDSTQIHLSALNKRQSQLRFHDCLPLAPPLESPSSEPLNALCQAVQRYRRQAAPCVVFMGAHPIKLGLARYLIDLIQRGIITHLATNGAGLIHDFELALGGETSEDVARWIEAGQFGLWQETSQLNDIIHEAACRDEGLGEAVGRVIERGHQEWKGDYVDYLG